jgi:hypothetical protein
VAGDCGFLLEAAEFAELLAADWANESFAVTTFAL